MNNMLYFSSEIKMGAQKKSGGKKFFRRFAPEFGPHFQFASYAPAAEPVATATPPACRNTRDSIAYHFLTFIVLLNTTAHLVTYTLV